MGLLMTAELSHEQLSSKMFNSILSQPRAQSSALG